MSATVTAALEYAARGWPVLAVHAGGKAPATPHGVRDATTDPDVIRRWFRRSPDANLAIATGAPGPQVLDVDELERARLILARVDDAPQVATSRGRHLYFAGSSSGTIGLGYGELRGRGSYVVAPPSTHPSGKAYVWLLAPSGPLPPVPAFVLPAINGTAGSGEHRAPARGELVPHGQRHWYLTDFAIRLVRAGVLDEHRVLAHLRFEFDLSCEPLPRPARGDLEAIVRWAVRSQIAHRERNY